MSVSPVQVAGALGVVLLTAIVAAVALLVTNESGGDEGFDLAEYPDIQEFMALDTLLPQDAETRFLAALENGGLHPTQFELVISSWRACNEQRCVGTVISADESRVTLEAVLDGRTWSIGVSTETQISRGGAPIDAEDLEPGEFVESLAQDGMRADLILSHSEPFER